MKTAQQAASKWLSGMQQSADAVKEGVQAVTVAPGAAAARQADVWASQTAAAKAKFARNVGRVSLGDWQAAMIQKGAPRIAEGATTAQPKVEAFMSKFLPAVAAAVASLPPRGNLETNIARSAAFQRKMAQFQNG